MLRVISMVLLLLTSLAGCSHAARKDVAGIVRQQRALLGMNRSVFNVPEAHLYLNELGSYVLEAAKELEDVENKRRSKTLDIYDRFDVFLVHSVAPNAWVFGDDFVCVTTALLLEAETPEEVVSVLAHEFGHLKEGHFVEREERKHAAKARYVALAALAGGIGGYIGDTTLMHTVLNNGQAIMNNYARYDMKGEYEADAYGLRIYNCLGLDLSLCDDFLERSRRLYGDTGGRTHPFKSQRLRRMLEQISTFEEQEEPIEFNRAEFRRIQGLVAQHLFLLANSRQLYSNEAEELRLQQAGYAVHVTTACGPFDAPQDRLLNNFVKAANLRLMQATPVPPDE